MTSCCGSASGDSAAQPERPQLRQYTAGSDAAAGRSIVSVPGIDCGCRGAEAGVPECSSPPAVGGPAAIAARRAAVRSSSYHRNSGARRTPRSTRVTGRTHRWASMCSSGLGRFSSDSGSRAADSSATKRDSACRASRGFSRAVRPHAYPKPPSRSRSSHSPSGSPSSRDSTLCVKSCRLSILPIWKALSPRRSSSRSASPSRSSRSGCASTLGPPEASMTSLGWGGSGSS
jgi:hypothetical protein